jgi:hypothetical protein
MTDLGYYDGPIEKFTARDLGVKKMQEDLGGHRRRGLRSGDARRAQGQGKHIIEL